MISLFLNTSVNFLNVAILKENTVLKEKYVSLDNDLSKITLSIIDEMLNDLNIDRKSINEIVCVNGPGSFTGLRIGVTIAKVYAYSLGIDIVCVSSLYTMATGIVSDYIVPIIDARRGYVFSGIYDHNYNSIMDDCYIKYEDLLVKTNELKGNVIFVSGDGFNNSLEYVPDTNNLFKNLNRKYVDSFSFIPNYLKRVEAEEKLNG